MTKTILIIEDERPQSLALQKKFQNEGFTVMVAYNGEEGLQLALREHPDLILLDVVMPVMDGISVLKNLRDDSWGKEVPVIILTNLSDTKRLDEGMELKAENYLIKSDWTLKDVVKVVRDKLYL